MGLSKSCAIIGALVLISCGSPAELDEESFPSLDDSGYTSTGTGSGGSGNTQAVVPSGGAGNGAAGAGALGNAGSTGGPPVGSAGASGMMLAGGCPPDITVLLARPMAQGGCTEGGGCHEATSPIKPDLVSPGLASRLLNVASNCARTIGGASVAPRPYIGAADSFLEEKIADPAGNPACGEGMPFFNEDKLSAADRQCIINWIDQVAAGGG